jgi:hypothetical protein
MRLKPLFPAVLSLLLLVASFASAATDPVAEVIAKARARVGGDKALDSLTSIRYEGTITADENMSGTVEILFQRPMQQRVQLEIGEIRETTALNGLDGWHRVQRLDDPTAWELTLLDAVGVRRLQANTIENLGFFRGLTSHGGRVEHRGNETLDGREAVMVAFIHPNNIVFTRWFDQKTGELLQTQTESGGLIREEGEIKVNGIRFPKKIVTTINGKSSSITFTKIQVNQSFPESLFEVPMPQP